jgi:RND superfamily putative drug exporter
VSALTRWVLSHKRTVVVSWVVLTIAGIAAAGPATRALKQQFSVPGKEGWKTNQLIDRTYGGTGGMTAPLVPVVTLPAGKTVDSPGVRAQLRQIGDRIGQAVPGARVASYATTGNRAFVSRDGRTTFMLAYPPRDRKQAFGDNPKAEKKARKALRGTTIAGASVHLTGFDALQDQSGGGNGPGLFLEAMIGGIGALAVLAFVFASLLAFLPIVMAIVSIMTTFLLLWALTTVTDVSPIVQFLVALIGLGVAIDYSLLVATRWREERDRGHVGDEAVQRAMETAGRAVVFSGTTVAIGLFAMIALPLPFLRSIGYGGMLIPLVSTLSAITLLPVVLAKAGNRLDWPHRHRDDRASRMWTKWAQAVARRRWVSALGGMAVILALVIAATGLKFGTANADAIAHPGDAKDGLVALERSGIGAGALLPHEVLVRGGNPTQVAATLERVEGVRGAIAPPGPAWNRAGTSLVDVIGTADGSSSSGRDTLDRVRKTARGLPGVRVGGAAAQDADFTSAVYGSFPLMIALVALVTLVLLARAFRSLLLPVKAVILNILSVTATWGVLVLVWQQGHGSEQLWSIDATGSLPSWIPLMVFAFLFGLSMDYEVFILARMREEYDATGSTREAVVRGIGRTGRLVTSAALILFLAFVSMASGPDTYAKMFATGLGAGILLDATVIRALFVPAAVSLFGRWNWWLPRWPARLLRVEPSLPPKVAPGEAGG